MWFTMAYQNLKNVWKDYMEHDLNIIITAAITCLIGVIYIFLYPQKGMNYSKYVRLSFVGISILFITAMLNSLIESRWELDYIISFLAIRKVGEWLFRISASLGYIAVLWGLSGIVVIKFRKGKKPTS
jgi:hypothetical protein